MTNIASTGRRSLPVLAACFVIAMAALMPATVVSSGSPVDFGAGPDAWADDLTPIGVDDWNRARAAHLLERAGFGGSPSEVDRLALMTPAEAVAYLVDYQQVDSPEYPPFEESDIYPHGHKFKGIGELARDAMATGKALGIPARQ